jgi:DNA-binding response OmpR family regulator
MSDVNPSAGIIAAPRVLLIEDEDEIGNVLIRVMQRAGMQTAWARTGAEAFSMNAEFKPEVALVDLNLPDTNGVALVSWLAKQGTCGVIVVSGAGEEADRIVGLELGADDYISKPPHLRELLARIRAVHRRMQVRSSDTPTESPSRAISVGSFLVDVAHRSVHADNGERISLTGAEFSALEAMLLANGQPVSRDELCRAALHRPWRPEDRSVDQLIFNLRQKLPGEGDRLIQSIRGSGYLLASARAERPAAAFA